MEFVENLFDIINNNSKSNHNTSPTQFIIIEYLERCYDCKILLNESFKCNGCNIIRCRFHYYVNGVVACCVECQESNLQIRYVSNYKLYKCCNCDRDALYGFINDVMLCSDCVELMQYKNDNIICFGTWCCVYYPGHIPCCGTGWYTARTASSYRPSMVAYTNIMNSQNNNFCIKHKKDDYVPYTLKIRNMLN
jgi:hypothetical protein